MTHVYYVYPGGGFKALTLSYDDNTPEANCRLVEMFNRYGLRCTFHLNSGLYPADVDIAELRALYSGHEIACHTATHPTIERCPTTEVLHEILSDRVFLEKVAGYPVRGMSYPNRSNTAEIVSFLPSCGIRYSREGETTGNFKPTQDFYHWKGTCHHGPEMMTLGKEFLDASKWQYLMHMFVWGHSFEFDRDGNWDLMEEFCQMMGGRNDIWYCTCIEFADYMDALHRLRFAADNSFVYNPSDVDCTLLVNNEKTVVVPAGKQVALA